MRPRQRTTAVIATILQTNKMLATFCRKGKDRMPLPTKCCAGGRFSSFGALGEIAFTLCWQKLYHAWHCSTLEHSKNSVESSTDSIKKQQQLEGGDPNFFLSEQMISNTLLLSSEALSSCVMRRTFRHSIHVFAHSFSL